MKKVIISSLFMLLLIMTTVEAQTTVDYIKIDTFTISMDTTDYHFTTYTPMAGAAFSFERTKPDELDTNIGLCMVAAFTSKPPEHIVGTTVCKGELRIDSTESETGYCLIIDGVVVIHPLSLRREQSICRAIEQKGDYFQQMLLTYKHKPVPTNVFKNRTTARRALVIANQKPFIVETNDRIHIDTFTTCLLRIGVEQAIYLDMGSWSEGWYRTNNQTIQRIGNNRRSTHLQTNWITIKRRK